MKRRVSARKCTRAQVYYKKKTQLSRGLKRKVCINLKTRTKFLALHFRFRKKKNTTILQHTIRNWTCVHTEIRLLAY